MPKSITEWLAEGESLYSGALDEYKELEQQRSELRRKMDEKLGELNRLGAVINKPPIEPRSSRSSSSSSSSSSSGSGTSVSGTVVEGSKYGSSSGSVAGVVSPVGAGGGPNTANAIARALQGRR